MTCRGRSRWAWGNRYCVPSPGEILIATSRVNFKRPAIAYFGAAGAGAGARRKACGLNRNSLDHSALRTGRDYRDHLSFILVLLRNPLENWFLS